MIKLHGIVSGIIPYSDSSQILKVLSWDRAHLSIMAKGWRKKPEPLLRFCEYEFSLYEPKTEGLYLLKEASLMEDFSSYPTTQSWAAAEAGMELISKIMIPITESDQYYVLLREYLIYLQKTGNNGILIFWRLFLRIFKLMGIANENTGCHICGKQKLVYAIDGCSEHICKDCYMSRENIYPYTVFSDSAQKILALMPEIGLHLNELRLTKGLVAELNSYFLNYYIAHQKQTLKLKSLSVLSQFYEA